MLKHHIGAGCALLIAVGCGQDETQFGQYETSAESLIRDTGFDVQSFFDGQCSEGEDRSFIREVSRILYLYPDQLPDLSVAGFSSPRSYLSSLVADVDLAPEVPSINAEDRFSFVIDQDTFNQISSGNVVAFGIRYRIESAPVNGERGLRLLDVMGENERENPTSASTAGLRRGDRIVAVNGRSVANILAGRSSGQTELDAIRAALGSTSARLVVVRLDGSRVRTRIVRELIRGTQVPVVKVFERGEGESARRVGYMLYRSFTGPSGEELRRAAAELEAERVTDLILDLRYNGGGSVAVANYLANLIYGSRVPGQVLVSTVANDQNPTFNTTERFGPAICPTNSNCRGRSVPLSSLRSLTVITTSSTASASERIISGLRPYLPVRVVGSRSFGKPVGQLPAEHDDCGQVYGPVTFKSSNSLGRGNFFNGFDVNCAAADEATRSLGDENEASLKAALAFYDGQGCPGGAPSSRASRSVESQDERPENYGELLEELSWQ